MEHKRDKESLEIDIQESSQTMLLDKKVRYKWQFYLWVSLSTFFFGTKMVGIGISKINEFWVYFIEHLFIFFTAIIGFFITKYYPYNKPSNRVFSSWGITFGSILSGVCDTVGNMVIIFSIKFAFAAGVSPASINSLLMLNAIVILVFGIYLFKEKHTFMEYIGGGLIIMALVVITMQRGGSNEGEFESLQFFMAISTTVVCALVWGIVSVAAKYATLYYNADPQEFGVLGMFVSGILGSFSIFAVYWIDIWDVGVKEREVISKDRLWLYVAGAAGAGFFTTFGVFTMVRSLRYGSAEVQSLFTNMRVIVQMFEELLIFQIIPSLISLFGVALALIGSTLMIVFEHKESHANKKQNQIEFENSN